MRNQLKNKKNIQQGNEFSLCRSSTKYNTQGIILDFTVRVAHWFVQVRDILLMEFDQSMA